MRFKNAVFDLDGTLTDSGEGITKSVEYALNKMGINEYEPSTLYRFIGPPLLESFMQYFGMDKDDAELAVKYYRERYSSKGVYENRLYVGVKQLLTELKQNGINIYVASSKPQLFVEKILKQHGIFDMFNFVAGASFDKTRADKPSVLKYLMDNTEVTADSAVMIGDRMHDIEGAHTFNMKCIAVLYGFGNLEEFKTYKADFVAKNTEDIIKIIKENNNG